MFKQPQNFPFRIAAFLFVGLFILVLVINLFSDGQFSFANFDSLVFPLSILAGASLIAVALARFSVGRSGNRPHVGSVIQKPRRNETGTLVKYVDTIAQGTIPPIPALGTDWVLDDQASAAVGETVNFVLNNKNKAVIV